MTAPGPLLVGLAVGGGTGPELADLFRRAVAALADPREIEFAVASHRFRTFGEVLHGESDGDGAEHAAREDARIYEALLRDLRRRGGRVVFRTAFNAHSLYRVRERLMAVKVEMLPLPEGELLLVRDATQGFYGGDNTTPDGQDEIRRTCRFSRDSTRRVLAFAVAEAVAHYGVGAPLDHAVVAYKFHVLGTRFARWVAEFGAESGVPFQLWQPDTTNRHLLRGALAGRVLLVGANEWADVMHADLLARCGLRAQEERCSRTVYLHDEVAGLEELQTVHGSADDLAGQGMVNPVATLRAAALLAERFGGTAGAVTAMEGALAAAAAEGYVTPDAGGTSTTSAVADQVLSRLAVARVGSETAASRWAVPSAAP